MKFSLDIRSMNNDDLHALEKDILTYLEKTAQERNLTYEMQTKLEVEPSDMDDTLKSYLRQSILKLGYSSININSGGRS